jgi:AcrR family transcriptional regulator
MPKEAENKHTTRSAQTRHRFIAAAEELFSSRSIDSVSLNEITVAAGQKNRNALQYHFGSREGLLQAIIDRHAARVHELREEYLKAQKKGASPARKAARGLVMPLAQYIAEDPTGVHYVKILSQLAALNNQIVNPASRSGLSFQREKALAESMRDAVAHLSQEEAQQRLFLTLSITFHGLADVCRAAESKNIAATLSDQKPLFDQVALAVEALLAAPAHQN